MVEKSLNTYFHLYPYQHSAAKCSAPTTPIMNSEELFWSLQTDGWSLHYYIAIILYVKRNSRTMSKENFLFVEMQLMKRHRIGVIDLIWL